MPTIKPHRSAFDARSVGFDGWQLTFLVYFFLVIVFITAILNNGFSCTLRLLPVTTMTIATPTTGSYKQEGRSRIKRWSAVFQWASNLVDLLWGMLLEWLWVERKKSKAKPKIS